MKTTLKTFLKTNRIVLATALLAFAAVPLAAQVKTQSRQPDYATAMQHEHAMETPAPSPAALIAPRTPVVDEMVTYATIDGKAIKGFLAKPAKQGVGKPALLMVHEWWGLNDNIKAVAKRYAGEGYTVLAVDLFGSVATTPDAAMQLYKNAMANVPVGEKNIYDAIDFLKKQGATSIGSVGYCFGGHWSLRTGLVGGKDIKAVVIYYGAPITDASQLARLSAPVLGLYGGKDTGIPVDSVRAMEAKLKGAGRAVAINVYADANHAFANPTGQAYNKAAAEDAWAKSLLFFKTNLK